MIANRILICSFNTKLEEKHKKLSKPEIKILSRKNEPLFEEKITFSKGSDLSVSPITPSIPSLLSPYSPLLFLTTLFQMFYYNFWERKADEEFLIFNPQLLIMVYPITVYDRINTLLQIQKFSQILPLLSEFSLELEPNFKHQIHHQYVNYLISRKQYPEAVQIIVQTAKNDLQLWVDWLFKFEQIRKLEYLVAFVPLRYPTLSQELYMKFPSAFLQQNKFQVLNQCVRRFKFDYVSCELILNAVLLRMEMKDGKEEELDRNSDLMSVLEFLYLGFYDYENAFRVQVKMESIQVFQTLSNIEKFEIVLPVIKQLLQLNSTKTVKFLYEQIGKTYTVSYCFVNKVSR